LALSSIERFGEDKFDQILISKPWQSSNFYLFKILNHIYRYLFSRIQISQNNKFLCFDKPIKRLNLILLQI